MIIACSTCKNTFEQTSENFYPDKRRPSGFQSRCKKCCRISTKEWMKNNKEKVREYKKKEGKKHAEKYNDKAKKWYAENKERAKEYKRNHYDIAWQEKHKEKTRETKRMWREKNIEKERAKTRNYRAKKKAGGSHTGQEIENLYLAQNGRCFYCHKKVGNNFEVDHIIPISKNGKNTIENLAIACRSCNRRKHNKLPGDFILH